MSLGPIVGFLETTIARNETIDLHTKRLLKHLPNDIPSFQLNVSSLYVRSGLRCRVVMIRADPVHVATLQNEFIKLNEKKTTTFFHWGEYLSLTTDQREDVIQHQNKWFSNIRCLLLGGFTETATTIPMKTADLPTMKNTVEEYDYLSKTTITNYFKNYENAGNGSNLFAYVYNPIDGIFEFLVKAQHASEATDYLKTAIGELTKRMSEDVLQLSFTDVEAATRTIYLPPWRPYSRCTQLLPAKMPTGEHQFNSYNNKRTRNEESYVTKPAYSTMTATTKTDSVSVLSNETNTINDMYKKIEEMQRTMDEKIQTHINRNNEKTMQVIQERNDNLKEELTIKIETSSTATNTVLTTLTNMMMSMQAEQKESSKNIGTMMQQFSMFSNQSNIAMSNDSRNESIELSFESDMKDSASILDTPIKDKTTHRYNTRSTGSNAT